MKLVNTYLGFKRMEDADVSAVAGILLALLPVRFSKFAMLTVSWWPRRTRTERELSG